MQLASNRLQIRESTPDDWPAYQRIWTDFALSEYAQYDAPGETEPEKVRSLLQTLLGHGRFYSVFLAESEEMIGYVCFHGSEESLDLGYCFHSASHGKGYAREACSLLMEALSREGVSRFTAGTALKNLPSVRLLTALGFRLVGREKVSFYQDDQGNYIWFEGGVFERPARSSGQK